jgi:2-C-methyl-D-erythritol 2,4-cyclodiphosphate synthase
LPKRVAEMVATGIGWDVHRLVAGRPLVLGGVRVPSELGLDGHSDADVLTHAVIDALLGAAGLGDVGEHFPDTDERWRGADSLDLLRRVRELLAAHGASIANVDVTVMLERPQLLEHKPAMRAALAGALELPLARVNVKATRGEGMGFVGRVEGAAALAVATVELPAAPKADRRPVR